VRKLSYLILFLVLVTMSGCINNKEKVNYPKKEIIKNLKYTIVGQKDKKLSAEYIAFYKSIDKYPECTKRRKPSSKRRVPLKHSIRTEVPDEKYKLNIPITFSSKEKNIDCNYKIISLFLRIHRKNDDKYTSFGIYKSDKKGQVSYYGIGDFLQKKRGRIFSQSYDGWRAGKGSKDFSLPSALKTEKNHFLLTEESNFLCKTKWYNYKSVYSRLGDNDFHCTLKINNGEEKDKLQFLSKFHTEATHPSFGADTLKNQTLYINILVDKNASKAYFSKSKPNEPYPFQEVGKK